MVKLRAYTTIEALISSILILTVLSIAIMIMLNVMASNKSAVKYKAKKKLIELALKNDLSIVPFQGETFKVEAEIQNYKTISDIKKIDLIAYDNQGILIEKVSFLKKNKE